MESSAIQSRITFGILSEQRLIANTTDYGHVSKDCGVE